MRCASHLHSGHALYLSNKSFCAPSLAELRVNKDVIRDRVSSYDITLCFILHTDMILIGRVTKRSVGAIFFKPLANKLTWSNN